MPEFELKEISAFREFLALGAVRVSPEQRRFTKHALMTWLQTRHPAVTTYAIEGAGQLIGYVMLIHAENPTQWIIERLTIDREHQRQGYGYAVVDHLVDMIHDFESSELVIARYRPENEAARALFAKLNFVEREETFRGRNLATLEFEFEDGPEDEDEPDDDELDDEYDDDDDDDDDDDVDEDYAEAGEPKEQ